MTWVDVAWVAMCAASLTLGVVHLFIWTRQPARLDYLLFFVLAAAATTFGGFELAMMRANTPVDYATALRWGHVPLAIFVVSIPFFVLAHFGAGRQWLAVAIAALRVLTLAFNFTSGGNVNFQEITALQHYRLLGDMVAVPIGVASRWSFIPQLSNALLLVFVLDASITLWRRGGPRARRRAVLVGGSVAICIAATAVSAALIILGILPRPTILTPAFLIVVFAMSYELGGDVIRAAQLAAALKASEARVRASEQRLNAVVEATPSAILLVDMQGRIVFANAHAEAVFGYSRQELLTRQVDMLVPERLRRLHEAHRATFAANASARSMGVGRDLWGLRGDGVEIPVEVGLAPVRTADDTYVLVSVLDITERRNIERAAAHQRAELAHLSRVATLGQLSGSLAHELNQPLTAIVSNAQAGQRFLARDPPDLAQVDGILADVVRSGHRAGAVIQRLRSLFRKDEARYEALDVNDVVEESKRVLESDLLHRQVTLVTALSPGVPPVRGDRVQLQQVLLNLIVNACDAMEHIAPAARRVVVVTEESTTGGVEIRVVDQGTGIASAEADRIFEPFVTTKASGLGLGLALCRTIVDAHRGQMRIANNPMGGSTFTIELPALEDRRSERRRSGMEP